MTESDTHRKVIIIGSGCAGYTAALYAARANLMPLVFEGVEQGGQLALTTLVENFPGFPEGVMGPDLMNAMRGQAEKFGAQFQFGEVTSADLSQRPFKIVRDGTAYSAQTLIIASGASAKMLGIESERTLLGHGVSTCATCDGFFFKDKELTVIGGGDSALEEGTFLTKFASKVNIIHRRDKLRGSKIMQDRALANEKVSFIWNAEVILVIGSKEGGVSAVRLRDTVSGREWEKECQGVFVAIGHTPNTTIFEGQVDLDEKGYIITKGNTSFTNIAGVFAAGDVHDTRYRQAITAAGSGCKAAIDAEKFLEEHGEG
ncbi:MAG: thioredoxin-disulfide reductase [Deltaproteobacteria bacterium]